MRLGLTITAAATLTLVVTSSATAAPGQLKYRNCITGSTNAEPACTDIISATADGGGSGLNAVESVTVSPDDKWVYAIARADDSIARFKRRRDTGKLTYRGCTTGDVQSDSGACEEIPTATIGGAGSGLDDVRALAISADGTSAYAVVAGQDDDAVARFTRNKHNGVLTFADCITGATFSGPGPVGTDACAIIPSAADFGTDSGLDHPKSLLLGPEGKSLYVASTSDAAVARFRIDPGTGELTYKDCITGELETGSTGTGACTDTPHATSGGFGSGLSDVRGLTLGRGADVLYGVAADDDSIARFSRDTTPARSPSRVASAAIRTPAPAVRRPASSRRRRQGAA